MVKPSGNKCAFHQIENKRIYDQRSFTILSPRMSRLYSYVLCKVAEPRHKDMRIADRDKAITIKDSLKAKKFTSKISLLDIYMILQKKNFLVVSLPTLFLQT